MVCVRSISVLTLDRRRDRGLQPRQRRLDALDRLDDVGAGLLDDDQHDSARPLLMRVVGGRGLAGIGPGRQLACSPAPSTATPMSRTRTGAPLR